MQSAELQQRLKRPAGDAAAAGLLIFLVVILFYDILFLGNGFYVRDLTTYHYPMKRVLRSIVSSGQFPYWNPYASAGQPMAANPAYEIFYPPQWLIFLPGFHFGYHLHILIHVVLALLGMYFLLRSLGAGVGASLFGSVSFGLGGVCLSLTNLLPTLFSFAWLPFVALFSRRFLLRPNARDFALASVCFGMQLLVGEPAILLQSLLLLSALSIDQGLRQPVDRLRTSTRNLALVGMITAGAAGVGAAQLIPAIDFARDTIRAGGLPEHIAGAWSMPAIRPIEFFYPMVFGPVGDSGRLYWGAGLYAPQAVPYLFSLYFGLLGAALVVGGLVERPKPVGLLVSLVLLSFALAIGIHGPLFELLRPIPILRSIRFPERFALLGIFAMVVFAGLMFQRLLDGDRRLLRSAAAACVVIAAVALGFGLFSLSTGYEESFARFWGTDSAAAAQMAKINAREWWLAATRAGVLSVLLLWKLRKPHRQWSLAIVLFLIADLAPLANRLNPRMPQRFFDPPDLASKLPPDRDQYRIFHHADWMRETADGRHYLANPALPVFWVMRNGMFPLTPSSWGYRTVLESRTDVTMLAATRSLLELVPRVAARRPADWVHRYGAISNVWIRAELRPAEGEIVRARGNPETIRPVFLVHTPPWPRYYFADRVVTIRDSRQFVLGITSDSFTARTAFVPFPSFDPGSGRVLSLAETANGAALSVVCDRLSYLVAAVSLHRYWKATVDGREVPIHRTNLGYQGIIVPPGAHQVRFRYRNPVVIGSMFLSALSVLLLAGASFLSARRRRLVAMREPV